MPRVIDVVFDGPPDHDMPRFVEVEDEFGKSIRAGEWVERPDGFWYLRLLVHHSTVASTPQQESDK